jgi:magnesium-transporting ATPase (P-type)
MKINLENYDTQPKKVNTRITKRVKKKQLSYAELFYGTLNIAFSLIIIIVILILNQIKSIINNLLGQNFPLETNLILFLSLLIMVLGVLFEIYSVEKARDKNYLLIAFILFLLALFMTFSITFIIIKYSLNWIGIQLFGNTAIGLNNWFYLPSIVYLGYSIFNVYYSFALMQREK